MSIRVTTQMTTNMMKTSINKSYADIYKVYQQITSGKKLSEMSEAAFREGVRDADDLVLSEAEKLIHK